MNSYLYLDDVSTFYLNMSGWDAVLYAMKKATKNAGVDYPYCGNGLRFKGDLNDRDNHSTVMIHNQDIPTFVARVKEIIGC